MKNILFILIIIFFGCSNKQTLTSNQILEKSIKKHDPNNHLKDLNFKVRVQEPRLDNPVRFSVVTLNNKTGKFELQRNRDTHISKHIIDENGIAKTLLNDSVIKDTLLIKKYRLEPKRNYSYRRFYQSFSLLPMSLQNEKHVLKETINKVKFNKIPAYKITLELEEPMFSKHWNMFFSQDDFTFLGVEMIFPNDTSKGERIYFDGNFIIDNVSFSRYHHWHNLNGTYLGSDIFVKEIK